MKTLLKHANYLDVSYEKKFIGKDILIEGIELLRSVIGSMKRECDLVLDLERSYVLPGLIDLHVHLCWDGAQTLWRARSRLSRLTLLRMVRHAGDTLRSGIRPFAILGSVNDLSITLSRGIQEKVILAPGSLQQARVSS